MGTEWIGIFGTAIGAVIAGGFAVINRRYQIKDEIDKLTLQNNIALNKEKLDKLSSRKEELFNLMQTISTGFSVTQNYRMKQVNFSSNEYDAHYEKMNQLVLRAELLAHLYFPEQINEVNNIIGLTNVIWGYQQRYFSYKESNQNQEQQIINEIVHQSLELGEKCSAVMKSLSRNNFWRLLKNS